MASGNRSSVRSLLSCPSAWPFTAVGSATIVHLPASPSPVRHNVKSGSRFADSLDKSTITGPPPCANTAPATPNSAKERKPRGRDSSSDRSRQMEDDAGHRTGQKRLDHAGLEPEDCYQRGGRQKQRPGIDARNRRHIKGQTEAAQMSDLVKPGVQGKPDSQIEDHTNDGSGDTRERSVQGLVVPQPLDKRRAKADPQKARYERAPSGEQPAEGACNHRWQRARMPERCEKADKLHNHDQRPRRRLGHAEPIEHFARP